jgi:hypothetical protein
VLDTLAADPSWGYVLVRTGGGGQVYEVRLEEVPRPPAPEVGGP